MVREDTESAQGGEIADAGPRRGRFGTLCIRDTRLTHPIEDESGAMAGPERGFSGLTKRDLLDMVAEPKRVLQRARGASSKASFAKRLLWDAVPRPHFAYGMYHGADQARALGLDAISVLEFGVAGGNGLVAMEELAGQITAELGVRIEIYGFDTGAGMPAPQDYRDMAYVWQPGAFEMDVPALEARLDDGQAGAG